MQQVTLHTDGDSSQLADLRYFPIVFFRWNGTATMSVVDNYFAVRLAADIRARAENTKVILISDLSNVSAPPASVRKEIAERAVERDQSDAMHCYFTVVPNALMRGVITAMQWIGRGQIKPNFNVASRAEAIRRAKEEYHKLAIEVPSVSETYDFPQL